MAFSDDDIMPFDGVKRVMQAVEKYGDKLVCMRFPLMVIDACGNMKYQNPPFETERISGYEFLLDKLSGRLVRLLVSMFLAVMFGNK